MLPLAISTMPNLMPPAPSTSSSSQSAPFSVQSDSAALSRQLLPIAVSSTGAPAAYSPNSMQSRQSQNERRTSAVNPSAAEAIEEGEEQAGSDEATHVAAPQSLIPSAQFFNVQPNRLGLSFSSQFAAQYLAQETHPILINWKNALAPARPGVGRAHGAQAYGVAVARNASKRPDADTTL